MRFDVTRSAAQVLGEGESRRSLGASVRQPREPVAVARLIERAVTGELLASQVRKLREQVRPVLGQILLVAFDCLGPRQPE